MSRDKIFIGTSGWTYDDWQGRFYPDDVRRADRLSFYAQQFNAVEVNATFYRLPTANMVQAWNRRLGGGFRLVLKGSRLITHRQRLSDCGEAVGQFFERVQQLQRLAVVLWQLPPTLHKDVGRLAVFLDGLPKSVRHAVEFRHASWWDSEVAETLAQHEASFVAVSHPDLPEDIVPTADFLYIRFHGKGRQLYRYDYTDDELTAWAERLTEHLPRRQLYAFFNNDYEANAPRNARRFRELLGDATSRG